jgi:Phage tail sheath C-terminal domain
MALVSPGVEVTVIDESQYLPAPTNSIPFILLATAENKANPTGTGVAQGTTASNAGKLFQVTSQRDLVTLYGNPLFYSTSNGTPIQGYELNEYGLLAAYSALGITNRVFCVRADIDLASLVGQTGRPTGNPDAGAYWLDTTTSTWGINEFNSTTGQFTLKTPIVITDSTLLVGGYPLQSVGAVGDYAVNAIPTYDFPTAATAVQFFYKNSSNIWVSIGSQEWLASWPTVTAANTVVTLTATDTLTISINGSVSATITVPVAPDNTPANLASQINALGYEYLSAAVVSGKLQIFSTQNASTFNDAVPYNLVISGTGTLLTQFGITPGVYYQPGFTYGTSSQQPLWTTGQTYPRPNGSVWMKIGSAGSGLNTVISQWDATILSWVPKTVSYAYSDVIATNALDSTGGKNIPAGTVYTQYDFNSSILSIDSDPPLYYWERLATGPTVITGTVADPSFTNGPYTFVASASIPGSGGSVTRSISLGDNTDATDFVNAWNSAAVTYTTATVTDAGAIQLTHTEGGIIYLDDYDSTTGVSSGLIEDAGFVIGSTLGVKEGTSTSISFQPEQTSTSGVGSDLTINVQTSYQKYYVNPAAFPNAGSGFAVGDTVTFAGTDFGGTSPANDLVVKITSVSTGAVTGLTIVSGVAPAAYTTQLSNWVEFEMTANEGAPVASPENLTNWFYSVVDEVDIMVNTSVGWRGYKNVSYDGNGFPLPSGVNATDPNGPIVSASEPSVQSDGTALVYGDIWIDTSDLENYPIISRWQSVEGTDKWVLIDNTDQTGSSGIVFADARWAPNGTTNPANDPIPTIVSLLTSNYLDIDAPDNALYPTGMLLFNTRRSGYNIKQYNVNYFNSTRFPDESLPTEKDAWVTVSGLQSNGAPYMGRKAQRAMVVQSMRAAIDTNTAIRDEDNNFNLIATPNYPELQPNMVALNNERGQTGFIIGDTPLRLPDDATAIQAWATNAAGATSTGEDGLVTRNTYMGLFYPSGIAPDLSGNLVAVPPSHMMIRTILRNDNIAYPWFAPAGTRRGIIDNATNIGYIDAATGEFQVIKTRIGIRDVLYTNQINPLVFFTGNGLLNYGNKSSFDSQSALDRVNVARLIAYIRRQLTIAARPFVFEPNDALTRQEISGVVQTLMVDLVAKRGIYDYLVVCDESNNTPARIDRNELWVDVAIEPVKAIEFIYIPVRVFNTGEISGQ